MKQDLEDALTSKQETEAALITAQARITQLETALRDGTKIDFMTLIYDLSGWYGEFYAFYNINSYYFRVTINFTENYVKVNVIV